MRKQLAISFAVTAILLAITATVILYGKGYRFGFSGGTPKVAGTGLLVATSTPNGAQVFVNGELTTATDNTINLSPGEYEVRIYKDGYFAWNKKITVKKEVVSKADALLIPAAPKLENITNIGVSNPVLDPTKTLLAYNVSSQSALKNGIYILDMTLRPVLTLQNASTQVANDAGLNFSQSTITWSPDSKELLASFTTPLASHYLLAADSLNTSPDNVTLTLDTVNATWEDLKLEKEMARIAGLKKNVRAVVSQYFNVLDWSADDTKILYSASVSGTIEPLINPPLIGTNSTQESRDIEKDSVYVYDTKEDKNYKILDNLPKMAEDSPLPINWYPDSKHLVYVHNGKIDIMEYDAQNQTTVYAGPFVDSFVFSWPGASKLVILTNLGNLAITPNLYTISLK
ncbi:MAG: hypothetical protein A3B38_02430 [Candidatus Levybacteria bacterium RIFCSPLOWO2_01_FULL_36_13]|nr:MAG: hypothetical protein A2684_03625 [Candidatus Levybacteria bacterium RIFCSPHIGHO2_01_FULL_36_15b]OGH35142.1 MAG: hypothetical protein A3B38_02430 [Candidatus Levybacteria bacterium RIFCSPLOWO2_01_FULL_36_13]